MTTRRAFLLMCAVASGYTERALRHFRGLTGITPRLPDVKPV